MSAHFHGASGREIPYPRRRYAPPNRTPNLAVIEAQGVAGTFAALMLFSMWVGAAFASFAVATFSPAWTVIAAVLMGLTVLPATFLLLVFLTRSYRPGFGYGMAFWLSAIWVVVPVNLLWLLERL